MQYYQLPAYKNAETLTVSLYGYIKHFPKDVKPTIVIRVTNLALSILNYLKEISNNNNPTFRSSVLDTILSKLSQIELLMRTSFRMKILNAIGFNDINHQINELESHLKKWKSSMMRYQTGI